MSKKISVTVGLPTVDYESNSKTRKIKAGVIELLKENLPGMTFFGEKHCFDLDFIKQGNRHGFSFAFSKFDDGFREYVFDGFRYKTKEIRKALAKVIDKYDMDPKVKYDRGFGVFVYNIFV